MCIYLATRTVSHSNDGYGLCWLCRNYCCRWLVCISRRRRCHSEACRRRTCRLSVWVTWWIRRFAWFCWGVRWRWFTKTSIDRSLCHPGIKSNDGVLSFYIYFRVSRDAQIEIEIEIEIEKVCGKITQLVWYQAVLFRNNTACQQPSCVIFL